MEHLAKNTDKKNDIKIEKGLNLLSPVMSIAIFILVIGPVIPICALFDGLTPTLELKILFTVFLLFCAMFQIKFLPLGMAFVASYTALFLRKPLGLNTEQMKELANYAWRTDNYLNNRC